MDGTARPDNGTVYYAIDAIQTVIHEQLTSSFQYFEYMPKKEQVKVRTSDIVLTPIPHLKLGFPLCRGLVGKT